MLTSIVAAVCFAPVLGPAPFRFAVYGDTRDGHEAHRKVVALISKEPVSFVVNTGDLVNRGTKPELWKIFDDITGELRKQMPYFAVRGNHDFGDGDFNARFPEQKKLAGNLPYFSFSKAGNHFVFLCIDEHVDYEKGTEQYRWLVNDLKANAPKSKHTFLFFHVPPYSIGTHGPDKDVEKNICPLMDQYKVDAVFNGHDHNYYRTKRNQTTYVVAGGGGAPLYRCDPTKGAIEGDKYETVNHYVVVTVEGKKVEMKTIRADGTVLETFKIR